jgi:hypothetical protein
LENPVSAIEDSLPNGFHDSILLKHYVDYAKRKAEIFLDIDISDWESSDGSIHYKPGKLTLTELVFFIIEPPRSIDEVKKDSGRWCDAGPLEGEKLKKVYPIDIPEYFSAYWFFLNETNSFIYMASKNADFEWLKE